MNDNQKQSNEQRYYDALRQISRAQTPEYLRKHSLKDYGLDFEEAIEYAHDNIRELATRAIHGRRRPKA